MTALAVTCVGMPDYTARCIRALIEDFDGGVEVVSTRPNVPIEGMERSLGQKVHWIAGNTDRLTWKNLGLGVPDVLLLGGYFLAPFRMLAAEVRGAGGKVILGSDNNWQGNLKQLLLDPLRHRMLLARKFDGVMTTGASGVRYSCAMGYPKDRIVTGVYGADPTLFNGGVPLSQRPKTLLFVGQLIERKNVLSLARAFVRIAGDHPDWSLDICGSGPLRGDIPSHPSIRVRDFMQPPQLAPLLRDARCLVLPSLEEHWGVVVHEAALSGCALALTDVVGAADDFAMAENSVLFPPRDEGAIERALRQIMSWDDARWAAAEATSRAVGAQFGPHRFSRELRGLVELLLQDRAP